MRPSEAVRIEAADIYKGDDLAAQITRRDGGTVFAYTTEYVTSAGVAIASTLPLRSAPFRREGGAVPPFFAGLLPEGARLQAVINAVRTSADDELSLLLAVGHDAVGDVRVVPAGEPPTDVSAEAQMDPTEVVFRDLLARAVSGTSDSLDAALPGVQDKLSDAMISFPIKGARRPAILKLDPTSYPLITANEHFFLTMARSAGFTVPRHELVIDATGEPGLLVQRFDREKGSDGGLVRIAQEDGCQMLDRYPADKYRVAVNDLANRVTALATSPKAAMLDLTLQVAFSWAIGNGDLHGKNYSLQWRTDGITAATPVYDVVSTLPYPLDQHMAMDLDGRNANFKAAFFARFGERFGVPQTLTIRRLGDLADRMAPHVDDLDDIGYDTRTTEVMAAEIVRRIGSLYPDGS